MGLRLVGTTLFATFAIILLGLAKLHQKPLCINSHFIEKITFADQSGVFRCALNKTVPYSAEFKKYEKLLESEIVPFERWIRSYLPLKSPRIHLHLTPSPQLIRVAGTQIFLDPKNLEETGLLQREILRLALKNMEPKPTQLEALAEFYVRIWNRSFYYQFGGMSSYLSYQWWQQYNKLDLGSRHRFLGNLLTTTDHYLADQTRIADFDFLLLTSQLTGPTLSEYDFVQQRSRGLKFGIWYQNYIYHLPSRSRLPSDYFQKIQAHHFVWESCADLNLQSLVQIPAEVRKLLVVQNCDPQQKIDYTQYVEKGVESFAAQYPKLSFVRFDVPSLKSKKDFINLQYKIFDLMSKRQTDNPFFTAFGWQEVNLDQKLQIYVPRAYIDAVEFFRVQ